MLTIGMDTVDKIDLPLKRLGRGNNKVREVYDLDDKVLMFTSDRISAFDWVLPDLIQYKGKCLNQMSGFWFNYFDSVPNHMITTDVDKYPSELKDYKESLEGRSMLVKKATPLKAECIVRGYISGSAWKSYKKDNTVCGIKLPSGMKESEKFDEPLFTPSTKAPSGQHDENISYEQLEEIVGENDASTLRDLSLSIYKTAAAYAKQKGIIIADTKFEFGKVGDQIILIDEVLTPDSSRFWPFDKYEPGRSQESFDKQYVRDWLTNESGWDKNSPPPRLPHHVIKTTEGKYKEAYHKITGRKLA